MPKKIGITCDDYKTEKFRERILKEGFVFAFDGKSHINGLHLFSIEVDEKDFNSIRVKLSIILTELEISFKQSN